MNMDNLLNSASNPQENTAVGDSLWNYLQAMSSEATSELSKPNSTEVLQVMERNITALLGNLPPEHFGVMVTTSREHLGRLLASAMLNGYFLRNVEQRMAIEKSLQLAPTDSTDGEY